MWFLRKSKKPVTPEKSNKKHKGFTLIELMAVMGIMGVLSGLVTGAVGGISQKGQMTQLESDRNAIGNAADQFLNESFPQSYPVISLSDTNPAALLAGDLGVRLINFDARLLGDPTKTFVPDFLKEIPQSSSLVSWRIDTNTGVIFYAQDGSQLIPPSDSRLNVSPVSNVSGAISNYLINLKVKKNQAALNSLKIEIPQGYVLGAQNLPPGVIIGSLNGSFQSDNPWDPGQTITFNGVLQTTGSSNQWALKVYYDQNSSTSGLQNVDLMNSGPTIRTETANVIAPTQESSGQLEIGFDRAGDPAQNLASENWDLTIYGSVNSNGTTVSVITNPQTPDVYRWLGEQNTTIDVPGIYDSVPGSQAAVIKAQ